MTNYSNNRYNNSRNMIDYNNNGSSGLTAAGSPQQRSMGTCEMRKHRNSEEDTKLVTCINGT